MGLDFIGGNPFRGEQTPQGGVLTGDGPRHALHLKRGLAIAALVLADPTLQVLEELTLPRARATLVLSVESEGFGGSVLEVSE